MTILVAIGAVAWSQARGGSAGRYVSNTGTAYEVSKTDAVHDISDADAAHQNATTGAARDVSVTDTASYIFNTGAAHDVSKPDAARYASNISAGHFAPNVDAAHFVSNADAAHFRYYGRWEHVRNLRDGRLFGSSSRTALRANSVTFFFSGTQARIYGVRGPGGGRGVLTVDGDHYFNVDFYAPAKIPQVVIYSTPILRTGKHFLVITPEAYPRSPRHHSSYINISGASFQ